mmetsp:Transcript_35668/g.82597  ORF Transcript_35668/g.82597 Transcript_35668/m.82597 type:complete len:239 (+) Transcript_35668:338-1054(+)
MAVGDGTDLAVGLLARQPHFKIIADTRREPQVARAELHTAIGQPKRLEELLGVARCFLVLGRRGLRRGDLDHFALRELVLAHEAARVAAVRACLCPEAWGECGDGDGQRFLVEDAALEQVGQRHLCGRNEEPILAVHEMVDLEQVVLELGQLAGALEHRAAHDERHRHFRVALFAQAVKEELCQRALKLRNGPGEHREARAREHGGLVRLPPVELDSDLVVPLVHAVLANLALVRPPL